MCNFWGVDLVRSSMAFAIYNRVCIMGIRHSCTIANCIHDEVKQSPLNGGFFVPVFWYD